MIKKHVRKSNGYVFECEDENRSDGRKAASQSDLLHHTDSGLECCECVV